MSFESGTIPDSVLHGSSVWQLGFGRIFTFWLVGWDWKHVVGPDLRIRVFMIQRIRLLKSVLTLFNTYQKMNIHLKF